MARQRQNGYWGSGLCDCSTHCSKCILAAILPCFQFGENYGLMQKLEIATLMDTLNIKSGKKNGESFVHPRTCGCLTYGCCTVMSLAGNSAVPMAGSWLSALSGLGCCINMCLHTFMRNDLRESRDIRGSCCADCLTVYFCYPCALTQEYKELKMVELLSYEQELSTLSSAPISTSRM